MGAEHPLYVMKLLALFAAVLVALAAVIQLDDAPPRADLVFVNRGEVFTLDPQRMSWLQDFRMSYALYEGLVRWNNFDFSMEPAAAQWQVSEDGLTYTFEIRPDARWSNGDPLTAHDFIYSWRRAMLPDDSRSAEDEMLEQLQEIEGVLHIWMGSPAHPMMWGPPGLTEKLSTLSGAVGAADVRPTQSMYTVFEDLSERFEVQQNRLNEIIGGN